MSLMYKKNEGVELCLRSLTDLLLFQPLDDIVIMKTLRNCQHGFSARIFDVWIRTVCQQHIEHRQAILFIHTPKDIKDKGFKLVSIGYAKTSVDIVINAVEHHRQAWNIQGGDSVPKRVWGYLYGFIHQ